MTASPGARGSPARRAQPTGASQQPSEGGSGPPAPRERAEGEGGSGHVAPTGPVAPSARSPRGERAEGEGGGRSPPERRRARHRGPEGPENWTPTLLLVTNSSGEDRSRSACGVNPTASPRVTPHVPALGSGARRVPCPPRPVREEGTGFQRTRPAGRRLWRPARAAVQTRQQATRTTEAPNREGNRAAATGTQQEQMSTSTKEGTI